MVKSSCLSWAGHHYWYSACLTASSYCGYHFKFAQASYGRHQASFPPIPHKCASLLAWKEPVQFEQSNFHGASSLPNYFVHWTMRCTCCYYCCGSPGYLSSAPSHSCWGVINDQAMWPKMETCASSPTSCAFHDADASACSDSCSLQSCASQHLT